MDSGVLFNLALIGDLLALDFTHVRHNLLSNYLKSTSKVNICKKKVFLPGALKSGRDILVNLMVTESRKLSITDFQHFTTPRYLQIYFLRFSFFIFVVSLITYKCLHVTHV